MTQQKGIMDAAVAYRQARDAREKAEEWVKLARRHDIGRRLQSHHRWVPILPDLPELRKLPADIYRAAPGDLADAWEPLLHTLRESIFEHGLQALREAERAAREALEIEVGKLSDDGGAA